MNRSCLHKRRSRAKGLSLMELIIGTFVVTIVSFGVISAYNSASRQGANSFAAANASFLLGGTMTSILNDAYGAVGKRTDLGIRIGGAVQAGNNSSLCVRTALSPVKWVCYTNSSGVLTTEGTLFRCTRSTLAPCVATDAEYRNLGSMRFNAMPAFSVVAGPVGSQKMLFTVTLSVADTSLTAGRRVQSGSVSPPGHST